MTKSFYGMVYRGGIALPMGVDSVSFLMEHNSEVELLECFTPQKGYIWATQIYVERKNRLQRYTQPILPNMEDLVYKAYHESNFMEHVPTKRFFSVIANGYAGIFTSVKSASEFLEYFHPTLLKEFTNEDEAVWHLNWFFLRQIFPRIAYIKVPIEYLKSVPLDTAVPLHFFGENEKPNFPNGLEIHYPELNPPSAS